MAILSIFHKLNPINLVKKWWHLRGFKKWLVAIAVIVVVSVIGGQISALVNKGKPNLSRYRLEKVVKKDMQKVISKEGLLRFAGVVDYPAPASGIVQNLFVKDGDQVKKGQKIVSIVSTATKQDQSLALSQYLSAKTALDTANTSKITSQVALEAARQQVLETSQARQNMDDRFAAGNRQNPTANRPDTQYTDNEIQAIKSSETQARARFTALEKEYNDSDAKIAAAQAALTNSLWQYELTKDAVVTAPFDGQVANLNLLPGETVTAKDGILFRLISSKDVIITVKASEAEIIRFQAGQSTEFRTPIYPNDKFTAKVMTVDSLGTEVKSDTSTTMEYTIKIKPDTTDKKFLSPMTVDTDTVVEQKPTVLIVPNSAITYGAGKRTVTQVVNGHTQVKEVVLGIIGNDSTEIISGLSEGDTVLVPKIGKI